MVGPLLCSLMTGYLSYPLLFLTVSLLPLIGFAILLLSKPCPEGFSEGMEGFQFSFLKEVVSSRDVLLLSAARTSFSFTNAFLTTLLTVYLVKDLLLPTFMAPLLFSVQGVANTLVRTPSGIISDRVGRKTPLLLSYGLLALTFLVISEAGSPWILALAMFLFGAGWGVRAVVEWTLLDEVVRPEVRTVAMAYLSSMFSLGLASGSVAAGALALHTPISTVFKLASVILALALIPVALLGRSKAS